MLALVADDDVPIQGLVRRCLERLGCTVRVFDNAEALLKASRRLKPDLVVSDVQMPGKLNGLEACRILRAERRETTVVLITGNLAGLEVLREADFDLVLIKPFRLEELEKAVARALKQKA